MIKRGVLPLALAGTGLLLLSLVPASGDPGGGSTPPPADSAAIGRTLFAAKGCNGCHTHNDVNPGSGIAVGPELTDQALDPDFLRNWLKDPAAVRPGTQMPNLRLSDQEIEALIAFLVPDSD